MYYIKRVLSIALFFTAYGLLRFWISKTDFSDWNSYVGVAVVGIGYVICGALLGLVLSDNLQLKTGSKGNVLLTVFFLIPALGFYIRNSNVYARLLPASVIDEVLIHAAPIFQLLLGAWLFLLLTSNKKRRRKRAW